MARTGKEAGSLMVRRDAAYVVQNIRPEGMDLVVLSDISVLGLCESLGLAKSVRQRALAQGRIVRLPTNEHLRGDTMLCAGDCVTLFFARPEVPVTGGTKPVSVLWHDRFALVANKPCGLLVHGDGTGADTLTGRVQGYVARVARQDGWPYVPVVQATNRLDVETSGIVLFSLTKEFQPSFDALVANHGASLHKRYLAIAKGMVQDGPFTIDAPIARDRHDSRRMRVGKTGKPSQTRAACVERGRGVSLVACELATGRRHQIRVHMASIGHPLVGDALYGPGGGSLMLHAASLSFVHPVTGERIVLNTEWPSRFTKLFSRRDIDWPILE